MSHEAETMAAIYSLLNGDATLLASGINRATGAARAVVILNQVPPDTNLPFIRFTMDSSEWVDEEPMGFDVQPNAKRLYVTFNVCSDFEPECRKITARLEELMKHARFITTNYNGWSWQSSPTRYYTDNVTIPDKAIETSSARFRVTMEPN